MKSYIPPLIILSLLSIISLIPAFASPPSTDNITTFYIVRHAETYPALAEEVLLNETGKQRAQDLAQLLEHKTIHAIYTSQMTCDKETAKQVAKNKKLIINTYDSQNIENFLQRILSQRKGQSLLIVGNLETVLSILQQLSSNFAPTSLDKTDYSILFEVLIKSENTADITRIQYSESKNIIGPNNNNDELVAEKAINTEETSSIIVPDGPTSNISVPPLTFPTNNNHLEKTVTAKESRNPSTTSVIAPSNPDIALPSEMKTAKVASPKSTKKLQKTSIPKIKTPKPKEKISKPKIKTPKSEENISKPKVKTSKTKNTPSIPKTVSKTPTKSIPVITPEPKLPSLSEQSYNLNKKNLVALGYDLVAYFKENKAIKGQEKHITTYRNANFSFNSKKNLNTFLANPEKYLPQYGGWCALGMSIEGTKDGYTADKYPADPENFKVIGGKLYLFYKTSDYDALQKWNEETDEAACIQRADTYWKKINE